MTPTAIRSLPVIALTFLAMLVPLACAAAPVEPAGTIVVSLDSNGMPIVEYALDAKAGEIRFVENDERSHDEVRKAFWKSQDTCATLSAQGIDLGPAPCRPRFQMDWDGLPRDRMYPALIRLQNGGVLIFTGYLAVTQDGLPLTWDVRASPNTVAAFRGASSDRHIAIDAATLRDDARGWIYIGPDRFASTVTAAILIDDGVPPVLEQVVSDVAARLLDLFASELSTPLATKPTFYLEWNSRDQPGRSLQADVVPGKVIRFGLSGEGWANSQPDDIARLRAVVAHEVAHFWNNGSYKPRKDAAPWLHEGNAELLSTAALLKLQLLEPAAAAERLNAAFNGCLLAAGSASWAALDGRDRGLTPYNCGMALQFAITAAVQRKHPAMDAFEVWQALWKANAEYGDQTLIDFLEQKVDAAGAVSLHNLLSDPERPLRPEFIGMLSNAGISVEEGGPLSPPEALQLASILVSALMRQDCAGSASFYTLEDHYLIDEVQACKLLRGGMKLRYVEGEDLFTNPQAALSKARRSCASGTPIGLRTIDDRSIRLACSPEAAARLPEDYAAVHVSPELLNRVLALPAR